MIKSFVKSNFITLCRIGVLALFIILWEVGVRLSVIDDFIFSSPVNIIVEFAENMHDLTLLRHIFITLLETLLSFALINIIGLVFAMLMWLIPVFSEIIEPFLVILNSVPKSALAPMLIVWLGNSPKAIIVTAISIAVFGTIINFYTGFINTDTNKLKLMRTFRANRFQILVKLILPANISLIISNMKVNIGLCLVGVIIGEFLAAREGLGYLIIYSSQIFAMDTIAMSLIILCFMSVLLFKIVDIIHSMVKRG